MINNNDNKKSTQGDRANKRHVLKCMKTKARGFDLEGALQYFKIFLKDELAKKNAEEYQMDVL